MQKFSLNTNNYNNDSDNEDNVNIFKSKIKSDNDNNGLFNPIKIDIKPKINNFDSNFNQDKLHNAQKILENQRDKMTNNRGSIGMTNSIGFLSLNSSLGRSSLINPIKMPEELKKKTDESILEIDDNEEFYMRKNNFKSNMNEKFAHRILGKKIEQQGKNDDDVEEIRTIPINSLKPKISNTEITQINTKQSEDNNHNLKKEELNKEKLEDNLKVLKNFNNKNQSITSVSSDKKASLLVSQDPKMILYNEINENKSDIDFVNLKSFIYSPLPKRTVFKCNIVRKGNDFFVYTFPTNKFIMAAQSQKKSTTSYYLITMNNSSFEKDNKFLGKLRSTGFLKNDYILYDSGANPSDTKNQNEWRCHLGLIQYESNIFGLKGPRKMKVSLAGITDSEKINEIRPSKNEDGIVELTKKQNNKILSFINLPPKWNEELQQYILGNYDRVQQESVKNFMVCDPYNEKFIYLQFGRIDDNSFSMDFKFPFSPIQAFGVCLSSLDK